MNDTSTTLSNSGEAIVPEQYMKGMERLVYAVQELSLARNLDTIMHVVRKAARELTGADGATFILKEGNSCFYAEENAIGPLWKGRRFPMTSCISGWAMLNKREAAIEDIYCDDRIPLDAYKPTFVRSLAMVPIRTMDPIGAIGNYWAERHMPAPHEIRLLQALADTTAVALENVQVYSELEERVKQRTVQLESLNKELEAFSYSVSHDLRAPLRHIDGFAKILLSDHRDVLDDEGKDCLDRINRAIGKMTRIIDDLLGLSRTTRLAVAREDVDLRPIITEIFESLRSQSPDRQVEVHIPENIKVHADPGLMRLVWDNLISNAWKFTSHTESPRIDIGIANTEGKDVYFVRDNGAGFDMQYARKLFGAFQRMHSDAEFPGTGIGLATVQRIIHKHGGRIWAESEIGKGATFYFTLS